MVGMYKPVEKPVYRASIGVYALYRSNIATFSDVEAHRVRGFRLQYCFPRVFR